MYLLTLHGTFPVTRHYPRDGGRHKYKIASDAALQTYRLMGAKENTQELVR